MAMSGKEPGDTPAGTAKVLQGFEAAATTMDSGFGHGGYLIGGSESEKQCEGAGEMCRCWNSANRRPGFATHYLSHGVNEC